MRVNGSKKIQRLKDYDLIKGEYFAILLNCKKESGSLIDVTPFTYRLEVHQYGSDRSLPLKTITGQKVDSNKVSFILSSTDTQQWRGKLEYIITLAYSNGNKNMGLGYITIM